MNNQILHLIILQVTVILCGQSIPADQFQSNSNASPKLVPSSDKQITKNELNFHYYLIDFVNKHPELNAYNTTFIAPRIVPFATECSVERPFRAKCITYLDVLLKLIDSKQINVNNQEKLLKEIFESANEDGTNEDYCDDVTKAIPAPGKNKMRVEWFFQGNRLLCG